MVALGGLALPYPQPGGPLARQPGWIHRRPTMKPRDRRPIRTDELYAPLEDRLRTMRTRVEHASLRAFDYENDDVDTREIVLD